MDKEQGMILAKLRFDRAKELLEESKELLDKGAFKSANNRAFYAIEKSIKALLPTTTTSILPARKRPDSRWRMQVISWLRLRRILLG